MKHIEIGFEDISKNFKKNKKGMLVLFLGILLGGAVCGYIDVRSFKQQPYTAEDTIVQKVDLEHLEKDETYYYSAFMEIKEKSNAVSAYIQYLKQMSLSGESMKKVSDLEIFSVEEQRKFTELKECFINEKPIICEDLDAAQRFMEQKLTIARLRLGTAEKTLEEYGEKAEDKVHYLKINAESDIEIWEDCLENLKDLDLETVRRVNSRMDLLLEEETDNINGLVERFNNMIVDIEQEEQYEVVYNPYLLKEYSITAGVTGRLYDVDIINEKKIGALIYARSIAGVDSREERFYAVLTFSALLGAALSLLYGSVNLSFPELFRDLIAGLYRRKK